MIDFVQAAIAGIASKKATDTIEKTIFPPPDHTSDDYLKDIHSIIVDMAAWLKDQQANQGDIFKYVRVSKAGLGAPYSPSHHGTRQHFQVFSPVQITLNATGSALGNFNVILSAASWTTLDFPDGTSYILDTSASTNTQVLWERETNANVV